MSQCKCLKAGFITIAQQNLHHGFSIISPLIKITLKQLIKGFWDGEGSG